MKSHLLAILLVVAIALLIFDATSTWTSPGLAETQLRSTTLQFAHSDGTLWFFDARTGDLWAYDVARRSPIWHFRLKGLGSPLETVSLTGKSLAELQKEAVPSSVRGGLPAGGSTTKH
jgi:hypothetical protein